MCCIIFPIGIEIYSHGLSHNSGLVTTLNRRQHGANEQEVLGTVGWWRTHLEPLNGLLAAWAEHDAVVQAADGARTAGQGGERWGRTHPSHGIGHCGEITSLIDSLPIIVIVLVIG